VADKKKSENQSKRDRLKMKNRSRIVAVSTLVIVALVAATVLMIFMNRQDAADDSESKQTPYRTDTSYTIDYDGQPLEGSSNAPVKVVEFADYQCPYCKQFENEVVPQLRQEFIQSDKVSFYFINYTILGEGSTLAANAAEEVFHQNPRAYWDFHKALFDAQGEVEKWVSVEKLLDIARRSVPSIDTKALQNAIETQSHRQEISEDNQMAENLDVPGTPTIFVNGKQVEGALDYDTLKAAIEQELAAQQ
jgi:protein-disulfide isomerase